MLLNASTLGRQGNQLRLQNYKKNPYPPNILDLENSADHRRSRPRFSPRPKQKAGNPTISGLSDPGGADCVFFSMSVDFIAP